MKKRIAILGSTGSIGTQTLEVIRNHPDLYEIVLVSANNNADLLIEQAIEFVPPHVVIGNASKKDLVTEALRHYPIKVYTGCEVIAELVTMPEIDLVLTALVGYAGLYPTLNAIKHGKDIALANKETLVVAGELITREARKYQVNLLPVDSEHSAIFQCLAGEENSAIEKIYLTASGGPFRGKKAHDLQTVTKKEALLHPNWCMGNKITIDSASFMNKGLEAIEAKWLFNLDPQQIEVIVHPQSIVHSMVQFTDGSMKAQMGIPDMKLPIHYALSYPNRISSKFKRFNFMDYPELTFEKPDPETFRNLSLAYQAMYQGGNVPCIMNAANEIVVEAFLSDKIGFLTMPDIIEKAMHDITYIKNPTLADYAQTDTETRNYIRKILPLFK